MYDGRPSRPLRDDRYVRQQDHDDTVHFTFKLNDSSKQTVASPMIFSKGDPYGKNWHLLL
jgi:hypothetical protein